MARLISMNYEAHKKEVDDRLEQLRDNKEEFNRIFARIYNMEGEVPIEVEDKYVSVARIFDTAEEIPESYKGNKYVRTKRDEIVSLISYAVGCMFGRYSLDVDGLVLANAGDTVEDYLAKMPDPAHVTFMPDADNVLPITDDEYFEDDAAARFARFVEAAYGPETLDELELSGIEVLREDENQMFTLKCALNEDLAGRSILLYRGARRAHPAPDAVQLRAGRRAVGIPLDHQMRHVGAAPGGNLLHGRRPQWPGCPRGRVRCERNLRPPKAAAHAAPRRGRGHLR